MAKYTTTDIIIICFGIILDIAIIILIIGEAEKQMYIFGLRPSESTSTDIAGLATISKGLVGKVDLVYRNVTQGVFYKIFIEDKIVCVYAQLTGAMNTTDCSSAAFNLGEDEFEGNGFEVTIRKDVETEVELK